MSASYISARIEARHQQLIDVLIAVSGDLAIVRDAIHKNTAAQARTADLLEKLEALTEKGDR
jgi:hypothetical protein